MSEFDQKQYRRLKARLTVKRNLLQEAQQSGNGKSADKTDAIITHARNLLTAVKEAESLFESSGYPDDWNRWEIAQSDAESQLARLGIKP